MRININSEDLEISVAAEEVAHFARTKKGTRNAFVFCESAPAPDSDGEFRRELSLHVTAGGLDFTLTGLCDILRSAGGVWTMEKIKEKKKEH